MEHMHTGSNGPVHRLMAMTALSFVSMYVLMYAMVDKVENALPNVNQFYMASLMTAAMVLIELAIMKGMYDAHTRKVGTVVSVIVLAASFFAIRNQAAVSDEAFLESMIPHHAAALLMCEKADLHDAEVAALCKRIIAGQQSEIDWMKAKLQTF